MEKIPAPPVKTELNKDETTTTTNVIDRETDFATPGLKYIPTDKLDPRSDELIAEWLQHKHSVTSEKNLWYFWHTGRRSMTPWIQRGIISSVRRLVSE